MCSQRVAVNDMYICEGTNIDIYVYIWKDVCSMILWMYVMYHSFPYECMYTWHHSYVSVRVSNINAHDVLWFVCKCRISVMYTGHVLLIPTYENVFWKIHVLKTLWWGMFSAWFSCIHVSGLIWIYADSSGYVCVCTCVHIYVYVYIHIHICMYIYTY